ncbi:hypothetical protein FACS189454_01560 [Planctomycetales bacterium]|nr:hypothetical protein FACS189454_01560 [Planctomycetales bacterium]
MYNCERQIPRVLAQFDEETQKMFAEMIVIDNDSKDSSIKAASDAAAELQHIKVSIRKNRENYNLGGSHKVAFNYALEHGFDYVVVLHGDDQGSIADLIPYIKSGEYENYDSLLGSRFMNGSKLVGYSRFRIFGNYVFNIFVSLISRRKLYDLGAGLNMYKTTYLKNQFYLYFPNNLAFNVYILYYGLWVKSVFKFFPLLWREDDQVSNAKLFKQSREICVLSLQFLFAPQRLFSAKRNEFSAINYQSDEQFTNQGT